jgi:hypothetical protein
MRFSEHFTRVKLPRWAAESSSGDDQPPDLGQVSELVRNTLTTEYDIYPPNLSTEINQDGSIKITAVNPTTGLNLQVTLQNLAGDLIHPSGQMTGVVPAEGELPGGGEGGVAGGAPGATGPPPGAPTQPAGVAPGLT